MNHCGVDMIINSKDNTGKIIELNTRPGIGLHLFPIEGSARDISKEIIDYYFPETKAQDTSGSNIYFDIGSIMNTLKERSTIQIEVFPAGLNRMITIRYIITAAIDVKQYYYWLKKLAIKHEMHGFIKEIHLNKFELVLAGKSKEELEKFENLLTQVTSYNVNIKVKDEWKAPVKLGFELKSDLHSLSNVELKNKLNDLRKEIKAVEKESLRLHKRIQQMKQSKAWKLTKPLRMFTDFRNRK